MRINYYKFPKETPEEIMLAEGCAVILKSGYKIYVDSIPADKRELVDYVDDTLHLSRVTDVKQLIKQYGGCGFTEHIDRDGCVFETTEIVVKGNNSDHKYNKHL